MKSNKDEIVHHIKESTLMGDGQLEEGDLITAAVMVLRVERIDDPEPQFAVAHTGDFITAAGLLALAKGIITSGCGSEEEDEV